MEPIVDGLADKYGENFKIVRVNVDNARGRQLAQEYGCIGQPAFVLFDGSGEQVRMLMGAQTIKTFEQEIERIIQRVP
jgi:thioredoxin-like negative regulator of GroEL